MEGIRILHDVPVWYDKMELTLDFHVFEHLLDGMPDQNIEVLDFEDMKV